MSEITDLKQTIKTKLDSISNRQQLRQINQMMDRLDDLAKFLEQQESAMPRGFGPDPTLANQKSTE